MDALFPFALGLLLGGTFGAIIVGMLNARAYDRGRRDTLRGIFRNGSQDAADRRPASRIDR